MMRREGAPARSSPPRKTLLIAARAGVSLLALYGLFRFAGSTDALARFAALRPRFLVLGFAAFALVMIFSGVRWQALLAGNRVHCSLKDAISLQWVGLFFTLFLPGSVGGDAVRSLYLARQHGRPAAVAIATVQERIIGMVALLVVGSIATLVTRGQLGPNLTASLLALQALAVMLAVLVFAFAPLMTLVRRFGQRTAIVGVAEARLVPRIPPRLRALSSPLLEPLALSESTWRNLILALLATTIAGLAMYWLLSLALGLTISWWGLCVAIPTVTVVRALPISFNGIGVGEGAFLAVLQPFGVPHGDALVLSLTGTAVHAVGGVVGGFILLWLTLRGAPSAEARATP